jgi:hypothetical protein
MYASKITVKKEPQTIYFEKKIDLGYDVTLSISELKEHGAKDYDSFRIVCDEFSKKYFLYISFSRLETKEEVDLRVAKEILYNENYVKFHEKYKK